MKKLLLILLCLPMIGFGQQTYVPDDNFEAYLEANGMGNGIANDDYVTTASINTVTFLDVSTNNISDLTGIEDFTSIHHLWCDFNNITVLDVSSNTALVELYCGYNELSSLNITNLTNLTNLRCEKNQLTSLDVSIATSLTDLKCRNNQLTNLNVSNNTALTMLYCDSNQLTSLDLRNGNNINMGGGSFFTSFSTNANPQLYCINVDNVSWSNANWTVYDENIDSHHYFSTNCPPLSVIEEHTTHKELLKVTDLLGRETKETNQPLFYIYDDGTVEKRIVIE